MGLAYCCAPWSLSAEDAALLAELGMDASSQGGPLAGTASVDDPSGETASADSFKKLDAVVAALARTPGAPAVLGVVSGPLGWGGRVAAATRAGASAGAGAIVDPVEAIDAAADVAADRLRALAGCGVERVAVVETGAPELYVDSALAAELHVPLVNTAKHLRIELVLVSTGTTAADALDYGCWVSSGGCSPGLGFLPDAAFHAEGNLRRCLAQATDLPGEGELVTAPLDERVSPDLVRMTAATLAAASAGALL